jgi:hypothetical protein
MFILPSIFTTTIIIMIGGSPWWYFFNLLIFTLYTSLLLKILSSIMLLLYTFYTLYGPSHDNLNLLPLIFVTFGNHNINSPCSKKFILFLSFCFLIIKCDSYFLHLACFSSKWTKSSILTQITTSISLLGTS